MLFFRSFLCIAIFVVRVQSGYYQNSSSSTSAASPTADTCSNCTVLADGITGHLWVQGILNYTAATIVTIIDYDTNTTSTTLIPNNASFTIDFSNGQNTQYYGADITGTVFTTTVFGTSTELIYPTPYLFIADLIATSATLVDSSCTTTEFNTAVQIIYAVTTPASWTTSYLGNFDTVPPEAYATISRISTCTAGSAAGVPTAKAAVNSLTSSSTKYIGTPPTPKPKPIPNPEPVPVPIPVPVPVPNPQPANPAPANPAPANPAPANPAPANPAPANPAPANPAPANPAPANPAPANPANPAPANPAPANPANPAPANPSPAANPAPANPASPNSQGGSIAPIVIPPGPTTISSGTAYVVVGGTSTVAIAPVALTPPHLTIGTQVVTANSASQYLVGSQTLAPGGPPVVISSTTFSLAPSATALIVGSSTVALPAAQPVSVPVSVAAFTVGGQTITVNPTGAFVVGTQTLTPGGLPATIGGTVVSIPAGGSELIVGSSTQMVATSTSTGLGDIILSGLGATGTPTTTASNPGFTGPLFTGGASASSIAGLRGWWSHLVGMVAYAVMI